MLVSRARPNSACDTCASKCLSIVLSVYPVNDISFPKLTG